MGKMKIEYRFCKQLKLYGTTFVTPYVHFHAPDSINVLRVSASNPAPAEILFPFLFKYPRLLSLLAFIFT